MLLIVCHNILIFTLVPKQFFQCLMLRLYDKQQRFWKLGNDSAQQLRHTLGFSLWSLRGLICLWRFQGSVICNCILNSKQVVSSPLCSFELTSVSLFECRICEQLHADFRMFSLWVAIMYWWKKNKNMLNNLKVSKQLACFLTLLIYLIMLLTYLIMLYWSNDNTILLQLKLSML